MPNSVDYSERFTTLFRELEEAYNKSRQEKYTIVSNIEAQTRMVYAVRGLLESGLKPGQDLNKKVLEAIELLKPYTCHGKDNLP